MSDDFDENDHVIPEDNPSFVGECICEHDPEEHSWGSCDVDGCPCEAGWEE